MLKKIFYILLFFNTIESFAQQQEGIKPSVKVMARSFGDSIILRWGVNTPLGWKLSNKDGFIIERYTLLKEDKLDKKNAPEKIILTVQPIKPWPLEKWENIAKQNNYGAISAQAIYGKTFEVTNKNSDVMQAVSLAQELEARFSFALFAADQSLNVAEASGLKFTDKNIKKDEKYVYKIYSLVPATSYAIDTGYVFIGTDERNPLPKPLELKADFGDRVVMLSWNKVYYEHIYTTYFIERSSDGGKTFVRTNALPIVNTSSSPASKAEKMYKVDSLPENNLNYVFRVRGITLFEETGPPSDTVQGTGKDPSLQLSPRIISVENQKDASIIIKWKFPEEYDDKIKEFEILRSLKVNGKYKSIGKVKSIAREYKDLKPERVNYYIIKAIDVSGLYSNSFPALGQPVDSISPSSPEGLTGKIDKAGKLMLQWKKGKEPDISGYRVYMANSKEEEFTQVTREPVRDTAFIDSINLNTITSKIYFKVMAVDLNYNLSSFSETLEIKRPDIIPPVSPVMETYKASDTAIYFKWIPSSSQDVVKHVLYRREKYSSNWNLVYQTESKINVYNDRDVKIKKEYEYVIVAVDGANLESGKKQIVTVSLIDYGFRPGIKNVEVKTDRLKKQVEIKWEYENLQPEKFLIYRAVKGEPLRLYKSVEGNLKIFTDKLLTMNTRYIYRVKASFPDGAESPLSKEIEVNY